MKIQKISLQFDLMTFVIAKSLLPHSRTSRSEQDVATGYSGQQQKQQQQQQQQQQQRYRGTKKCVAWFLLLF